MEKNQSSKISLISTINQLSKNIALSRQEQQSHNKLIQQSLVQNEKDHKRFETEFLDISRIIQQDRSSTQAQFTEIIKGSGDIAVLNSKMEEVKKVVEDRRYDSRQLFEKMNDLHSDLNEGLNAVRIYTDTKIEEEINKIVPKLNDNSNKIESLEKINSKSSGILTTINWILTVGLIAAVTIYGVIQTLGGSK